jgi:hypothetical protein
MQNTSYKGLTQCTVWKIWWMNEWMHRTEYTDGIDPWTDSDRLWTERWRTSDETATDIRQRSNAPQTHFGRKSNKCCTKSRTNVTHKSIGSRTDVARKSIRSRTNIGGTTKWHVTAIDYDVTTHECDGLQRGGWRHNKRGIANRNATTNGTTNHPICNDGMMNVL